MSIEEKYDEVRQLINIGKEKGYLLYDEVNELLPSEITSSDELDDLFNTFGSAGIEVIDSDQKYLRDDKAIDRTAEGAEELELDLTPGALDKTNDPVRMYLREMGTVPLLTREGEVEIARRIERGKLAVIKSISRTPLIAKKVILLGDQLHAGERTIRELVIFNDEEITDERVLNPKNRKQKLREDDKKNLQRMQKDQKLKLKAITDALEQEPNELKQTLDTILRGEYQAEQAKKELVEANLRLVVSIAKKYTNRGLQFLDLIQEGNIGLMKAVDKFEYRRGYKFSTYATWWIRQAITRAIADQARTIRIPVHMIETINKLIRTSRALVQELGREPTSEEIAKRMDIPVAKVRKVLKIAQEPISLETPIGEEEDSHLGDFIEDRGVVSPAEAVINLNLKEQTQMVLKTLTPREEKVIKMRFGLDDGSEHTLEEVGQSFAVTRERIRQIEAKALRKLRHPSRSRKLRAFLEGRTS